MAYFCTQDDLWALLKLSVDDVYAACDDIEKMGYGFKKTVDGGSMKGLAFALDPDGYSVEIIKRGGIDFGDKKVE